MFFVINIVVLLELTTMMNHPKKKNKIRIADIATTAGVSNATVSRVLNGQNIVNAKTYEKVISAMNALGYHHSISINTLSNKSTLNDLIILTLPSINNPFYNSVVRGVQSAAQRYGYYTLLYSTDLDGENLNRFISLIKDNNVAGVITLNNLTPAALAKISAATTVVQCCEFCEESDCSYVSIDDYQATKTALQHFLDRGRRKIAFINGPMRFKYARHRQRGYLDFIREHNLEFREDWIVQLSDINFDIALASITQLLSKDDRPDAVFAVSDIFASAAIKVAKKIDLLVPQDLMIIGFDNVDISLMSEPPITTVNQPKMQLGYMACEVLVERISAPDAPGKHILLDTELIVRDSTMA